MNLDYLVTTVGMNLKYGQGLVADIPEEQFCDQPGTIVNHPAWLLSHICSANETGLVLLGLEPVMPKEVASRYGRGSIPTKERSDYPSKSEICSTFERQMQALAAGIKSVDPALMEQPMPIDRLKERFPRVGDGIVFLLTFHVAIHLGQLSAWRRAMGMPPIN